MSQLHQERLNKLYERHKHSVTSDPARYAGDDPDGGRARRDPVLHVEGLPKWMVVVLEAGALALIAVLVAYGHPLYVCNQMRDNGQFYYGTTLKSCVVEQASRNLEGAQGLVARMASSR